jgi:hypothetical protein
MLAVLLTALLLLGCGGDGSSSPDEKRLSAAERSEVMRSQRAISTYCRRLRLYVVGRRGPPAQADTERAYGAVDQLVAIAREKPEAEASGQPSMRQLLGAIAEDLEGTNCSTELVRLIDQGLASLPEP